MIVHNDEPTNTKHLIKEGSNEQSSWEGGNVEKAVSIKMENIDYCKEHLCRKKQSESKILSSIM